MGDGRERTRSARPCWVSQGRIVGLWNETGQRKGRSLARAGRTDPGPTGSCVGIRVWPFVKATQRRAWGLVAGSGRGWPK